LPDRPSLHVMLRRAALRRCPWCGDRRAYFTGWFAKQDACGRCGAPWRRGDVGFELGAITVVTIITFGTVVIGVTIGMVVTAPEFAVVEILVGLAVVAVVMPVVVYPLGYTVWQALDIAMRPPEPGEFPSPPVEGSGRGGDA
jgi:uncharacterized protein (DUF983 family)